MRARIWKKSPRARGDGEIVFEAGFAGRDFLVAKVEQIEEAGAGLAAELGLDESGQMRPVSEDPVAELGRDLHANAGNEPEIGDLVVIAHEKTQAVIVEHEDGSQGV